MPYADPAVKRAWQAAHNRATYTPERGREQSLRLRYGITPADYDARLAAQGGCCAACKRPDSGWVGRFHIDHDHTTGQIRGLLCVGCNRAIGFAYDDPTVLRRLADYLEEYRKDSVPVVPPSSTERD